MAVSKHYYLYQVTNIKTGHFYIGKRVSNRTPEKDVYFGSGTGIAAAIKKYGSGLFRRDILGVVNSLSLLNDLEALVVDDVFIHRRDTYNIKRGGIGGDTHWMDKRESCERRIKALGGDLATQRVCYTCDEIKNIIDFVSRTRCRACKVLDDRHRYISDADRRRAYGRAQYALNPSLLCAKVRSRRATNPEVQRALDRARYAINIEKHRAKDRARYAADPNRRYKKRVVVISPSTISNV